MKKIIKINLLNYIVLIFFEAMFALISFDIYSKSEVLSILIYSLFSEETKIKEYEKDFSDSVFLVFSCHEHAGKNKS